MPLPEELLDDLRGVEGDVGNVRNAIDAVLSAGRDPDSQMTVDQGMAQLGTAADRWMESTDLLEQRLIAHAAQVPSDAEGVRGRLTGFALLHVATAADLSGLSPLDSAPGSTRIHVVAQQWGPMGSAETIQDAAFGEGQLVSMLSEPNDETPERPSIDPRSPADDVIDQVVTDLIERGSKVGTSVVLGLASGPIHVVSELLPHFDVVVSTIPVQANAGVRKVVRRVGRLVATLLRRVQALLDYVLGNYRQIAANLLRELRPDSDLVAAFGGEIVGRLVHGDSARARAHEAYSRQTDKAKVDGRLMKLTKTHGKWVDPVRVVAKGLPKLWAVPLGAPPLAIPAAPVAAVALLAWVILITGDQLDSSAPFPNFWKGVVRRSSGE